MHQAALTITVFGHRISNRGPSQRKKAGNPSNDVKLDAPKLFNLSGRVGPGSGIGQRGAFGLAQCAADVASLDSRTGGGLSDTEALIDKAGRKVLPLAADLTGKAAWVGAVARIESALGPLAIAVNATGIANVNPAEEIEENQYQRNCDTAHRECILFGN